MNTPYICDCGFNTMNAEQAVKHANGHELKQLTAGSALIGQFQVSPFRRTFEISIWLKFGKERVNDQWKLWIDDLGNPNAYVFRGNLNGYILADCPAYVKAAIKKQLRKVCSHVRSDQGNCLMQCGGLYSQALRISPAIYQDKLGNTFNLPA